MNPFNDSNNKYEFMYNNILNIFVRSIRKFEISFFICTKFYRPTEHRNERDENINICVNESCNLLCVCNTMRNDVLEQTDKIRREMSAMTFCQLVDINSFHFFG